MRAVTVIAICAAAAVAAVAAGQAAGNAERGKKVFESQSCSTCHSTGAERIVGPGLKGLFSRPKLANGKKPTEANVLAIIDQGGNGMPPFKDMLKAPEKADLIAYLNTL